VNADELVEVWALGEYKSKYRYYSDTSYFHKYNHLIMCPTVKATPVRMGWECGCYSEYTRDDGFETAFTISCACGVEDFFRLSKGEWDLPEILKQMEEYESTQFCPYWNEED